jgi:hypothetical protein
MWQRIHQIVEENPGHFETIQYGIQDGYQARQQNFNAREVLEQTELLEKSGKSWRGGNVDLIACMRANGGISLDNTFNFFFFQFESDWHIR